MVALFHKKVIIRGTCSERLGAKMITYDEAVAYLLDIPKFTKNKDNNNLRRILERMGNPDRDFKIIHVAGTNGKGSTCAFLNSILLRGGYSVGMFTSPHLVKINERIRINGANISDEKFLEAFLHAKSNVDKVIAEGGEHPSFFEYIFLVGISAFKEAKTEYVLLEVGLGGRLDATNIIETPAVSIITSISMDHMEILGDTIEDIAREKAGIIKKGVPVIFYGENSQVEQVITKRAEAVGADAVCVKDNQIKIVSKTNKSIDFCLSNSYDKYGVLSVPFVMEYQTRNAALAINAVDRLGVCITEDCVKQGLMDTVWSGRMEEIADKVYLDGAHNYDGVLQFKEHVNGLTADEDTGVYILFSVVKEKEYYQMMDLIEKIDGCKGFLVAPVNNARAAAVSELASYLEKSGKKVLTFDSLAKAYDYGVKIKEDKDYLFCVGSLYMVGEIKSHLEVSND